MHHALLLSGKDCVPQHELGVGDQLRIDVRDVSAINALFLD